MFIGKMMRAVLGGGDRDEKPGLTASPSGTQVPATITEEYRQMQTQLHRDPKYGMASVHYAQMVAQVIKAVGARRYFFGAYRSGKKDIAERA